MNDKKLQLEILEFIIRELRSMDGDITLQSVTQFENETFVFNDKTCFTQIIQDIKQKSKKNEQLLAYISRKEGEYDAYQKILKILEINFAI
jgi:hypothetical protein